MPGPDYRLQAFNRLIEQIEESGLTREEALQAVEIARFPEDTKSPLLDSMGEKPRRGAVDERVS